MIPVIGFRTNFHIEHKFDKKEDFKPILEIIALTPKLKYTLHDCKEVKNEFEISEQRIFLERKHIAYLISLLQNCDIILERDEHYIQALKNTIERDKQEDNEQIKGE